MGCFDYFYMQKVHFISLNNVACFSHRTHITIQIISLPCFKVVYFDKVFKSQKNVSKFLKVLKKLEIDCYIWKIQTKYLEIMKVLIYSFKNRFSSRKMGTISNKFRQFSKHSNQCMNLFKNFAHKIWGTTSMNTTYINVECINAIYAIVLVVFIFYCENFLKDV